MADSVPELLPGNPGTTARFRTAFANDEENWTEEMDLIELTASVLEAGGYEVIRGADSLEHPASGLLLLPRLVSFTPGEGRAVSTATTMQVHHPELFPNGVFEYQHGGGQCLQQGMSWAIDQWMQLDFVTFLDALRDTPGELMRMEMGFPPREDQPEHWRRIIPGPVMHYCSDPPADAGSEEHPFCPCCLFTNSIAAFHPCLDSQEFYALRLYAMRDENGEVQADCRLNGEDCEAGADALREYARTWPEAGFECRKQYVLIRSIDRPAHADS